MSPEHVNDKDAMIAALDKKASYLESLLEKRRLEYEQARELDQQENERLKQENAELLEQIDGYRESQNDKRRLVRELDQILNGDDAAQQASLCDIVAQLPHVLAQLRQRPLTKLLEAIREIDDELAGGMLFAPAPKHWDRIKDLAAQAEQEMEDGK